MPFLAIRSNGSIGSGPGGGRFPGGAPAASREDMRAVKPGRRYRMPRFALLAAAMSLAAPLAAGVPGEMDPVRIPNYRLIRPCVAVAGQPAPETLRQLGELGFRTVINIRTAGEGAEDEGEVVRSLGLRYVWIPVTPESLTLKDVEAIEAVVEDPAAGPVLFHCSSSNRVGGVWAVIQGRKGKSLEG